MNMGDRLMEYSGLIVLFLMYIVYLLKNTVGPLVRGYFEFDLGD